MGLARLPLITLVAFHAHSVVARKHGTDADAVRAEKLHAQRTLRECVFLCANAHVLLDSTGKLDRGLSLWCAFLFLSGLQSALEGTTRCFTVGAETFAGGAPEVLRVECTMVVGVFRTEVAWGIQYNFGTSLLTELFNLIRGLARSVQ